MKVSELLKVLKQGGVEFYKHGANHDIYKSPITGAKVQVPRHKNKELAKGTVDDILGRAGLK